MLLLAWLAACTDGDEGGPIDTGTVPDPTPPTTDSTVPSPADTAAVDTGAATGDTGAPAPTIAFTALVYRASLPGLLDPTVAEFGPDGCVIGERAVAVPRGLEQLVATADGRWFAIEPGGFGEVDPQTGAWTPIPYPAGWDVSWEMSVAVDPATGEVLIGTLGGRGELLAYDPASGAFSERGSFDNDDTVAIVALDDGTLLAALMPGSYDAGAVTTLASYALADVQKLGEIALSIPLAQPEPGDTVHHSSQTWQLRAHGGEVFALVRTDDPAAPVRTAKIDRVTGDVVPLVCP